MKINNIVIIIITLMITISCSKHKPAPVKEYSSHKQPKVKYAHSKIKRPSKEYVIVNKGDSLYSIGFDHNLDYKLLAKFNHIKPPYLIHPGQKLSLINNKEISKPKPKTQQIAKNTSKPKVKTQPVTINKTPKPTPKKQPPVKIVKKTIPTPKPKTITKPNPKKKPITSNSKWIWPVKGKIFSSFSQSDSTRKGIDIATQFSSPVHASNHGTVVYSGDGLRGYGELIIIKHDNNLLSAYAHNSQRFVKEGESIKQGQEIAKTGKDMDGKSLLHFEIRKNGKPVNPIKYLPKK